jgi:leucyl-tRNA synthetase
MQVLHPYGVIYCIIWETCCSGSHLQWTCTADDGKKESKSLNNYRSPMEVIDQYGAVSFLV